MILYNHQPKMQFDFKKLKFRFISIFNRTYDWGGYKGHIFHRSYHFIDFISSIIIWVFLKWRLLACKGILADKLLWLTVTLKYRDKKGRKKTMNSDCARDSEMLKVRFQYIVETDDWSFWRYQSNRKKWGKKIVRKSRKDRETREI